MATICPHPDTCYCLGLNTTACCQMHPHQLHKGITDLDHFVLCRIGSSVHALRLPEKVLAEAALPRVPGLASQGGSI